MLYDVDAREKLPRTDWLILFFFARRGKGGKRTDSDDLFVCFLFRLSSVCQSVSHPSFDVIRGDGDRNMPHYGVIASTSSAVFMGEMIR